MINLNKGQLVSKPHCPQCQKLLDGFTALDADSSPKPDDVTVCIYCQAVLQFTDALALEMADAEATANMTLQISIIQNTIKNTKH